MATGKKYISDNPLPEFHVICDAVQGDVDAINSILRCYGRYIAALSTRTLYDEDGNPHACLDDEMRRRLETKLITKILSFKISMNPA